MGCLADAGEAVGSRCLQARCPRAEPPGLRGDSACPAPAPPGPCAAGGAGCGQDAFRKCGRGSFWLSENPRSVKRNQWQALRPQTTGQSEGDGRARDRERRRGRAAWDSGRAAGQSGHRGEGAVSMREARAGHARGPELRRAAAPASRLLLALAL